MVYAVIVVTLILVLHQIYLELFIEFQVTQLQYSINQISVVTIHN